MLKKLFNFGLVLFLGLFLVACGDSRLPSVGTIERAIVLGVTQSQQALSHQLQIGMPKDIKVSKVDLHDPVTEVINNAPGYHLQGHYDLSFKQSDRRVSQKDLEFDIHLASEMVGKALRWQLAENIDGGWKVRALPQ
jgi:hypothetical protein